MQLSMSIEEIKKNIALETPLQVLADLNGLDLKTFEKILKKYEEETGEIVLPVRKRGRPKTNNPGRSTRYRRAKEEMDPADLAILDVIDEQIRSLNQLREDLQKQLEPIDRQIKRWQEMRGVIK